MLSEREARKDGATAGRNAASWLDVNDERHAARLLKMLNDGDPALDDYLPRRPDLSGEFAGESMNEVLDVQDDDDPDEIDEIADVWLEAADEAFNNEIERMLIEAAGNVADDDEDEE